ncbi:MAG: hypothetical protein ACRDHN_08025 [Thermomicrobiales bacterium]
MRWLNLFRRNRSNDLPAESLNLDGLLAEGLKDRPSAKRAIARLNREREAIIRSQRALIGGSKTLTPGNVKNIYRASSAAGSSDLASLHLSQAMQDANEGGRSGLNASGQLAMLDDRLAAIDRTRSQLYAAIDRIA